MLHGRAQSGGGGGCVSTAVTLQSNYMYIHGHFSVYFHFYT